jgi:hypothetical protein
MRWMEASVKQLGVRRKKTTLLSIRTCALRNKWVRNGGKTVSRIKISCSQ